MLHVQSAGFVDTEVMHRRLHLQEWCLEELLPQIKTLAQHPVTDSLPAVRHPTLFRRCRGVKGALAQRGQGAGPWSELGGPWCGRQLPRVCGQGQDYSQMSRHAFEMDHTLRLQVNGWTTVQHALPVLAFAQHSRELNCSVGATPHVTNGQGP